MNCSCQDYFMSSSYHYSSDQMCLVLLCWLCSFPSYIAFHVPSPTLSAVASLLIQKETQDRMTMRVQGTYTWIMKYTM